MSGGKDLVVANIRKLVCYNCKVPPTYSNKANEQKMHKCVGLGGIWAPYVVEGSKVRVFAVDRDDYVGKEKAQTNQKGRPVMAVVTEHADGRIDRAVLAPHAQMEVQKI